MACYYAFQLDLSEEKLKEKYFRSNKPLWCRVISIDEDLESRDVNIYKELKKNKAQHIYNWINKNYDKLDLDKWTSLEFSRKNEKLRLDEIKDKDKLLKILKML